MFRLTHNNAMHTDKVRLSRFLWRKSRASFPLPLIASVRQHPTAEAPTVVGFTKGEYCDA